MSAPASIPLFGDAYLADTQHLSLEEHGAYLKLMIIAWRAPNCALPDDDKRIATMLGIGPKKWSTLKLSVMAFWFLSDHGWQQKRLLKEYRWTLEKSAKARDAAAERHGKSFPAGAFGEGDNSISNGRSESGKSLESNNQDNANAGANAGANGHAPPPPPKKEERNDDAREIPAKPDGPKIDHAGRLTGGNDQAEEVAREVIRIAGFSYRPRDAGLAKAWLDAGADPEKHIYPEVEKLTAQARERGDPPASFNFFNQAVRLQTSNAVAKIDADIARWNAAADRARQFDEQQRIENAEIAANRQRMAERAAEARRAVG